MAKVNEEAGRVGDPLTIIFLLGAADTPVDGVEDYCSFLVSALRERGVNASAIRMPWKERGWLKGFLWLWRQAAEWRGKWVVLQYTALQWSNHALPVNLPLVFAILRLRGVRRAVVFHDAIPYPVRKAIDHIRRQFQLFIMRQVFEMAERVVVPNDPLKLSWITGSRAKCICIPVGANVPAVTPAPHSDESGMTVVVFSLTPGKLLVTEAKSIACILKRSAQGVAGVHLKVLGRNSREAESILRGELADTSIMLSVLGILCADDAAREIASSDVLLFVREGISNRRGSAIAGIVQGLPVVAYEGAETCYPVTEAGVLLAPEWDEIAIGRELTKVLTDSDLRARLCERSRSAADRYFSWGAIADAYLNSMSPDGCARTYTSSPIASLAIAGLGTSMLAFPTNHGLSSASCLLLGIRWAIDLAKQINFY